MFERWEKLITGGRQQVISQHNSGVCQPTSLITGNESRWNHKWVGHQEDGHQALLSFCFLGFHLPQMSPPLKSLIKRCE